MSFLSKIGDFFKKLFDALKKILAVLLVIIAVIMVVFAVIASGGSALVIFGFTFTPMLSAIIGLLALTGAFLIDPETTSEVVGKIGEALGDAAEAVGEIIGAVAGGVSSGLLSGFLSTPLGLVALGVGGFLLFQALSGDSQENTDNKIEPEEKEDEKVVLNQRTTPLLA